jgi:hypothetical protein
MKPNWAQGHYVLKNPAKYVGTGKPTFRSGWEHAFMRFLDENDHVVQWASESIRIPYRHPLTGKMTLYVPDFLMTYRTKDNTLKAELIEIKPSSQSVITEKMNSKDRAVVAVNHCKWDAASKWARRNGLTFRVLNEQHIFHNGKR